MKISELWLQELTNLNVNTATLVQQLTMAGLEVSGVERAAPEWNNVIVGRIIAVQPNPKREGISICQVDVGAEEPLTVICGGKNIRDELRVAVAVPGACLPNGIVIESVKKYGVLSQGMLCSATELGLLDAEQQAEEALRRHILALPEDAPIGMSLRDYLKLDDHILEIELTPNRSDCLSAFGLAREISTIFRLPPPKLPSCHPERALRMTGSALTPLRMTIQVNAPRACPRYYGCVIHGLNNQIATPLWLQEYLRRSQIRSISPIVDIANFVMLELGQPLHAFALEQIEEKIIVRMAQSGETIQLLNGNNATLDPQTLIIADASLPIALAGVMGSAPTGVNATTQDIFLESAFFNPAILSGTARRYGLNTDASMRFERGVDYQLPEIAMQRAIDLLIEICGGVAEPMVMFNSDADLPKSARILLRKHRIAAILGIELSDTEVEALLHALYFEIQTISEGWWIVPPSYRFDVRSEIDVIEEIARLYGYHNISASILPNAQPMTARSETYTPLTTVRTHLTVRGYSETITYSFAAHDMNLMLNPDIVPIELTNPLSTELATLRTSLFPNLLEALRYNCNRGVERLRLFEIGRKFSFADDASGILEKEVLAGLAYGPLMPMQWAEATRQTDFYDVKNDIESLLQRTGIETKFTVTQHPAFHPGKTALITQHDEPIGILGVLHPQLCKKLDLIIAPVLFELSLSPMQYSTLPCFKEISRYPAVVRDLAFVLSKDVIAAAIQQTIFAAAGSILQTLEFFDVYQGKNIAADQKSVAARLTFSSDTATLLDETINAAVENIVQQMQLKFSAVLRNF